MVDRTTSYLKINILKCVRTVCGTVEIYENYFEINGRKTE